MLENEARQLIANIRAMAESDRIGVPSKLVSHATKILMENSDIDVAVKNCIDKAHARRNSLLPVKPAPPNLPEIVDRNRLKECETEVTFLRLLELENKPVPPTFDIEHLCGIHRRLFVDLYDVAGKLRTNNVRLKNSDFLDERMINTSISSILSMIRREDTKDISRNDLSMRISYYLREIFIIHPFRDGNGRCTRVLFRQFADKMGFRLNYSKVDPVSLRAAEIHAFQTDNIRPLYLLINQCLNPI